jgi:hypothetical protein
MGKRLSVKHKKRRHDQHTTFLAGNAPAAHKVAIERSKKAKKKKAYPMT